MPLLLHINQCSRADHTSSEHHAHLLVPKHLLQLFPSTLADNGIPYLLLMNAIQMPRYLVTYADLSRDMHACVHSRRLLAR
jgi:hypothetical protein